MFIKGYTGQYSKPIQSRKNLHTLSTEELTISILFSHLHIGVPSGLLLRYKFSNQTSVHIPAIKFSLVVSCTSVVQKTNARPLSHWSYVKMWPTAQENSNAFISLWDNRAQIEIAALSVILKLSYKPVFLK
jgi:hypothetical protein